MAPTADLADTQPIMMLTSDISLINDPDYKEIVADYAANPSNFDDAFAHAWYKLVSRDMGPITRCKGGEVPDAQPFQYPLPPTPAASSLPPVADVMSALKSHLSASPSSVPAFASLAFSCASTFRRTDFLGGCDGARVRMEPERSFPGNEGAEEVLRELEEIRSEFPNLSVADIIVLGGNAAIEAAGGDVGTVCIGRTDAPDGDLGSEYLFPRIAGNEDIDIAHLYDSIDLLGLTKMEFVALSGGHDLAQEGAWAVNPAKLSVGYFDRLLNLEWDGEAAPYTAVGADNEKLFATEVDMLVRVDAQLQAAAQALLQDEDLFKQQFGKAWGKLMQNDLFFSNEERAELCA